MPSKTVLKRLESILQALNAGHSGGVDVSSHSMGRDRELFINLVLSNIMSVPFRVGTGDIVDQTDRLSLQADVVIEYSNTLSFPNIYPSSARLYLAESVCAVLEVKSTLDVQWKGVVKSAQALGKLHRETGVVAYTGVAPSETIPFFAVGYKGWENKSSAKSNLETANKGQVIVNGILQIDPCFFVGEGPFANHEFEGPAGLYGFLLSIEHLTSTMLGAKPPFLGYMK